MLKDLLINHLAPGEIDRTGERVDGKATIIGKLGYNWIAVLDAKYRGIFKRCETSVASNNKCHGAVTWYGDTSQINYNTVLPIDAPPSHILSDFLRDYVDCSVATHAYISNSTTNWSWANHAINNGGVAPNIQTLAFMYTKRQFIDDNDPTLDSYPNYSLVNNWGGPSRCFAATATQRYASEQYASFCGISSSGAYIFYSYTTEPADTCIIYPVLEIPAYEDRTGERIDNKATIIGRLGEHWIAVLDAAYRGAAKYCENITTSTTSGIPYTSGSYTVQSGWTENNILAQQLYDTHSSKWNTDYLNQVHTATDFPAAKFCYDIMIDGKHAQLGNIQTMAFVYSKKDYVDANDPTATANPTKKLSNWGFGTSGSRVYSSSNGNALGNACAITNNGAIANNLYRNAEFGVVPILEIPLYKDRTGERVDGKATIAGKLGNYWVAVLDAQYRDPNLKWGKYDVQLSGLATIVVPSAYIKKGLEESGILSSPQKDTETSRKNTSYLMTQNTGTDSKGTIGVPAAAHCFSHTILGTNAQMPNIQTSFFLYSKSSFIDANDPTVEENPNLSLSSIQADIWSSTQRSTTVSYVINSLRGDLTGVSKDSSQMACPILEIPLWCDDDYK